MKCPECGAKIDRNDYFCPECGAQLKETYSGEKTRTGFATASFILGLLGLILFFIPLLSFLAILFGIIALIKIASNKNLSGRGLAIAGLIFGLMKWLVIFLIIKKLPMLINALGPMFLMLLGAKL